MLTITFDAVSRPPGPPQRGHELEISVEGRIRIADAEGGMFEEPLFPIVELRSALKRWLTRGAEGDFAFASIEADESPLISFRSVQDGWEIGSPWSERSGRVSREELIAASSTFVADVDAWVLDNLGIADVDAFSRR